jgi:hypothetical protein
MNGIDAEPPNGRVVVREAAGRLFDRDGTINTRGLFIAPGASTLRCVDAIRLFKQAGYLVVVLTNQAGGPRHMAKTRRHARGPPRSAMRRRPDRQLLPSAAPATVPGYCDEAAPGLARRAAEELGIDSGDRCHRQPRRDIAVPGPSAAAASS